MNYFEKLFKIIIRFDMLVILFFFKFIKIFIFFNVDSLRCFMILRVVLLYLIIYLYWEKTIILKLK